MSAKKPRILKQTRNQKILSFKVVTLFPIWTLVIGLFLLLLSWLIFKESDKQEILGPSLEYALWASGFFIIGFCLIAIAVLKYIFRKIKK